MLKIWETCTFSDEIKYGKLDMSKFAVELHSVLDGTADEIYINPERFLANTFLTSNMRLILKEALVRLSRGEGQPVYIIDTEFGGGKTHTLILLYHIFRNRHLGNQYIRNYKLHEECHILEIPQVNVVALDCRRLRKNTFWGELADSLGKYEEVKELDQSRQPIKNIEILKSFFDKPTLLLIDELPHYLLKADAEKVGNITLADLTVGFIGDLISAVVSTKRTMLILTLTARQQLYEKYTERVKAGIKRLTDYRVDTLVDSLREALSRQVQFVVPVGKDEIYNVIKTRLVKGIKEKESKRMIEEFYDYYEDKGLIVDPNYKDKLELAYPFHPFLIDVLYERVSTLDKFNRTRGVLRLLALMLYSIYKKYGECYLLSSADLNLTDNEIVEELTSRIDRGEFKPVIESDVVRKARALDEKKHIKIVEKIARTIYLYSLIGATKISGIRPSEVKLAVCYPGIDPSIVDEALEEIDREFWFIRSERDEFFFDKEPNINKIIYDYAREVDQREVKEKIKETLKDFLPEQEGLSVVVWDKDKLEDNDKLKIFVLDYAEKINEENARELLRPLLEFHPRGGIRNYQNTIVFLYADEYGIDSLIERAKIVCAIEKTKKDERIRFDRDKLRKIGQRLEQEQGNLESDCLNVYSRVAFPYHQDIRIDTISISTLDTETKDLTSAILEFLRKKGKLIDKLSPDVIGDNIQDKTKVEDLYSLFKRDKSQRFILTGRVILDAVKEGVKRGIFGYSSRLEEKDGRYVAELGRDTYVDWGGWVVKKNLVYVEKPEAVGVTPTGVQPPTEIGVTVKVPQYNYQIDCGNLKEIVSVLDKLPIIMLGGGVAVELYAKLQNESDTITVVSRLKNMHEIRSLIQSLMARYSGSGRVTISSERDLSGDFRKYSIRVSGDKA